MTIEPHVHFDAKSSAYPVYVVEESAVVGRFSVELQNNSRVSIGKSALDLAFIDDFRRLDSVYALHVAVIEGGLDNYCFFVFALSHLQYSQRYFRLKLRAAI